MTVLAERKSWCPIAVLDSPSATSRSTSAVRSVKGLRPALGRGARPDKRRRLRPDLGAILCVGRGDDARQQMVEGVHRRV